MNYTYQTSTKAWAWEFLHGKTWVLCQWAEPSKEKLLAGGKPSPEARPVCVRLFRNRDASR